LKYHLILVVLLVEKGTVIMRGYRLEGIIKTVLLALGKCTVEMSAEVLGWRPLGGLIPLPLLLLSSQVKQGSTRTQRLAPF
jgi:hypothetical protein